MVCSLWPSIYEWRKKVNIGGKRLPPFVVVVVVVVIYFITLVVVIVVGGNKLNP